MLFWSSYVTDSDINCTWGKGIKNECERGIIIDVLSHVCPHVHWFEGFHKRHFATVHDPVQFPFSNCSPYVICFALLIVINWKIKFYIFLHLFPLQLTWIYILKLSNLHFCTQHFWITVTFPNPRITHTYIWIFISSEWLHSTAKRQCLTTREYRKKNSVHRVDKLNKIRQEIHNRIARYFSSINESQTTFSNVIRNRPMMSKNLVLVLVIHSTLLTSNIFQ